MVNAAPTGAVTQTKCCAVVGGVLGALAAANFATPQAVSTTVASAEPDIMMAETTVNDKVPPAAPEIAGETAAARARRLRPRAEDMFASDGE